MPLGVSYKITQIKLKWTVELITSGHISNSTKQYLDYKSLWIFINWIWNLDRDSIDTTVMNWFTVSFYLLNCFVQTSECITWCQSLMFLSSPHSSLPVFCHDSLFLPYYLSISLALILLSVFRSSPARLFVLFQTLSDFKVGEIHKGKEVKETLVRVGQRERRGCHLKSN